MQNKTNGARQTSRNSRVAQLQNKNRFLTAPKFPSYSMSSVLPPRDLAVFKSFPSLHLPDSERFENYRLGLTDHISDDF